MRWIQILGLVNVACFAAYTLLSYGLTPVVQLTPTLQHREAEVLSHLAESLAILGPDVQAYVTGRTALARPELFVLGLEASELTLRRVPRPEDLEHFLRE